jgi:hypothetical protein
VSVASWVPALPSSPRAAATARRGAAQVLHDRLEDDVVVAALGDLQPGGGAQLVEVLVAADGVAMVALAHRFPLVVDEAGPSQPPGQPVHGALERGQARRLHGMRVDEEPPARARGAPRLQQDLAHARLVQVLEHVEGVGAREAALAEGQPPEVAEDEVHLARGAGRKKGATSRPAARRPPWAA